jgi:hypothetical protein
LIENTGKKDGKKAVQFYLQAPADGAVKRLWKSWRRSRNLWWRCRATKLYQWSWINMQSAFITWGAIVCERRLGHARCQWGSDPRHL